MGLYLKSTFGSGLYSTAGSFSSTVFALVRGFFAVGAEVELEESLAGVTIGEGETFAVEEFE